jgi:hypothetical protein
VLFRLTIPRDVQLVAAVRQVAERVAQCAGYTAADAAAVASSVAQAMGTVLGRQAPAASTGHDLLDIRFEREGVHLDVWLRYRAGDGDRPVVDPALSSEALRQGMDSVEFGREGEMAWCRLRRVLPRQPVDHQCEMPPE